MKKYFYIFLMVVIAVVFSTCKEEDYATKEYYKNVVYLLSKETYNVYSQVYPFDDGEKVTGYLSIGCGGSRTNPQGFSVELESDTVLLDLYNRGNFDIDSAKFAKILPEDRYNVESHTVNFPANNPDQYVKVAINVVPDGLSPDSTYFIPLAIKSVSKYETNPDKSNVLFRVVLENYYAKQLTTNYQLDGLILNAVRDTIITGTKMVRPLSKNSVRMFAGVRPAQTDKSTLDEIKNYSIILTVGKNDSVKITPYGSIETKMIDEERWNIYEEVRKNAVTKDMDKYFKLYYSYRTVKTPATGSAPAVYNDWITVREILQRLDN